MPKKRVRGENVGELPHNKLYKSVHKCIRNNFFRFPESKPKRTAWINASRTKEWTPSESSWVCIVHFLSGMKLTTA